MGHLDEVQRSSVSLQLVKGQVSSSIVCVCLSKSLVLVKALHPLPPHPLETAMVPSPGLPPSFGWQWARPALPSIATTEDKIEAFHWNQHPQGATPRRTLRHHYCLCGVSCSSFGKTTHRIYIIPFSRKSPIDTHQPSPRRRPVQDEAVQDDNDLTEANASTDATRQTRRPTTNQPRRDEEANPQDDEKKLHPQDPVACVLCNRRTTRCDDVTEQAHEESRLRSTIPHPR